MKANIIAITCDELDLRYRQQWYRSYWSDPERDLSNTMLKPGGLI